jgi:hypothetical protein
MAFVMSDELAFAVFMALRCRSCRLRASKSERIISGARTIRAMIEWGEGQLMHNCKVSAVSDPNPQLSAS